MYSNGTVLSPFSSFRRASLARPFRTLQIYTRIYIPRERPFRSHSNSSFCLLSGCRDFLRDPLSPHHSLPTTRPRPLNFLRCYCFHRLFFARRSHENAILPANSRPVLILRRDLLIKKVPVARCLLDGLSPARDGWNVEHARRGCATKRFRFQVASFFQSFFRHFVRDREKRERETRRNKSTSNCFT